MTTDGHSDTPDQVAHANPLQVHLQRRAFIRRGAIGVGAVAVTALVPAVAMRELGAKEPSASAATVAPMTGDPMMIYVRDAERGEAVILSGAAERVVVDHALVQHLLRAQDRHLA